MGTYIKVEMCPNSQLAINALGGHNHGMKNRIASIRKKRGLSQSALAASLGTTLNMMGKLERGDRRLNSDWVVKLATALECDPSDLVGDEVPIVGKIGAGGSIIYEDVGIDETIGRPPDVEGRLIALEVAGFSMLPRFDDGDVIYVGATDAVSSIVEIRLTDVDGGGVLGPAIRIEVAFPIGHDTSIRDAQDAALESAYAVLARVAAEPPENLRRVLRK